MGPTLCMLRFYISVQCSIFQFHSLYAHTIGNNLVGPPCLSLSVLPVPVLNSAGPLPVLEEQTHTGPSISLITTGFRMFRSLALPFPMQVTMSFVPLLHRQTWEQSRAIWIIHCKWTLKYTNVLSRRLSRTSCDYISDFLLLTPPGSMSTLSL